jgi:mercuric ion binding protein
MKRFFLVLTLLLSAPAFAETIDVKVDGMVCAFCAAGIEQLFTDEPAVKKVHVDLDQSTLEINTKENAALTDARITELVEKAGFTASSITRQ